MDHYVSEVEAKFLVKQLNGRLDRLPMLGRGVTCRHWGRYLLHLVVGMALAYCWWWVSEDSAQAIVLFLAFAGSVGFAHSLSCRTNRRIDTLIALLKQEGALSPSET